MHAMRIALALQTDRQKQSMNVLWTTKRDSECYFRDGVVKYKCLMGWPRPGCFLTPLYFPRVLEKGESITRKGYLVCREAQRQADVDLSYILTRRKKK